MTEGSEHPHDDKWNGEDEYEDATDCFEHGAAAFCG